MPSVHINADTGYVSPEMMEILFRADAEGRAARANRRNNPRNPPRGDREQVPRTFEGLYEYIRRNDEVYNEAFRARRIREEVRIARMIQEGEAERRRQDEQWAAERRQQQEQQEAARAFAEATEARRAFTLRGLFVLTTLFWLALALIVGGGLHLSKDVEMAAQPAPDSELAIVKIKPEEVIANAFKDLFVSHADIIEMSMTPSSLNEVQGRALFDILSTEEEEEDCCDIDDVLCRLSAVAPKYVPAFLQPYLFEEDDEVEEPIHSFAWVVTVWDRSIYRDTTPWFLPTGPTDENSGVSFYQLEKGHSRNPDIQEEDLKVQQQLAEDFEVCAESDSLFDILSRVFTFSENSRIQDTIWYARTPSSPKTDLNGLLAQADARYRELPSIKWHYHLQGSLHYETTREYSNYETECELLWTKNPAFRPKTLWQKLQDDLFRKDKPHMPPIRRRSCTDLSPASTGADPVKIAVCHAYARDPQPIDYDTFPIKDLAEKPRYTKHVQAKISAMPLVSESCHVREFLNYEVLQQYYDYKSFCEALWVSFPHTSPRARRKKRVQRDDGSASTYWQEEYLKKPDREGFESFCLDFYFDRTFDDPSGGRDKPNADDYGLWLFHSA